jgi:integrase
MEEPMGRRTRSDVVEALGLRKKDGAKGEKKTPAGLTKKVLDAALVRPLPFRACLPDSGGKGHVQGLFIIINPGRPGPKERMVPGPAVFYAIARCGSGGPVRQVKLGKVGLMPLEDARVAAREMLNRLHRGEDPNKVKAEARIAEAARVGAKKYVEGDYWTKHLRNKKSGEAEKERLLTAWKDVLELRLDEVTADRINEALQARRDAGLAAGTLLRDWNSLRACLYQAVEDGVLAAVPFKSTPPALNGLKGTKRMRWLGQQDKGEVRRFEEALGNETPEVQAILKLLALTGMRRGELLGLKKSEVRLRDGVIVIPPERSKNGRQRIVRLNPDAKKVLETLKVVGVDGAYFPGSVDTWKVRLKRAVARIRRDAGIADFKAHDLRHHFATRLRQAGAPLEIVRDALGHADLKSTQIYAHVGEDELREAVAKVRL